jgi:hypothetical protein
MAKDMSEPPKLRPVGTEFDLTLPNGYVHHCRVKAHDKGRGMNWDTREEVSRLVEVHEIVSIEPPKIVQPPES